MMVTVWVKCPKCEEEFETETEVEIEPIENEGYW